MARPRADSCRNVQRHVQTSRTSRLTAPGSSAIRALPSRPLLCCHIPVSSPEAGRGSKGAPMNPAPRTDGPVSFFWELFENLPCLSFHKSETHFRLRGDCHEKIEQTAGRPDRDGRHTSLECRPVATGQIGGGPHPVPLFSGKKRQPHPGSASLESHLRSGHYLRRDRRCNGHPTLPQ
ncbi:MAG: hypothetical protein A4E70_02451 [Syntrophus sp. PtaU1.Bin005]|nr:MAG: hypothetical protein A4E70_02451 [Syntrophus sp. PtaU1.Bin005]